MRRRPVRLERNGRRLQADVTPQESSCEDPRQVIHICALGLLHRLVLGESREMHKDTRLRTDAELHTALQKLLQQATHRQVWLFFFDEKQRLIDLILPLDDHPEDPHRMEEVDDLGIVCPPELLVHRAQAIAEMVHAESFAIVWERLGPDKFTADDLDWARAFIDHAGRLSGGAPLRSVFLLHDGGLRPFTPDDYA